VYWRYIICYTIVIAQRDGFCQNLLVLFENHGHNNNNNNKPTLHFNNSDHLSQRVVCSLYVLCSTIGQSMYLCNLLPQTIEIRLYTELAWILQ